MKEAEAEQIVGKDIAFTGEMLTRVLLASNAMFSSSCTSEPVHGNTIRDICFDIVSESILTLMLLVANLANTK